MNPPTAPREEVTPLVTKWERQARTLIGSVLSSDTIEPLVQPLYTQVFHRGSAQVRTVESPYAAADLIATGAMGHPRLADDHWINPAVAGDLVGNGRLTFDTSFTIWSALARERSRLHSQVEEQMQWSAGLRLGVFDDWYPLYEWLNTTDPELVTGTQRPLLALSWHLGWFWTFEDAVLVCQPPTSVEQRADGTQALFRDGWLAAP